MGKAQQQASISPDRARSIANYSEYCQRDFTPLEFAQIKGFSSQIIDIASGLEIA